jgi:hypothetical protein
VALRKHHCRSCGGIFCWSCTPYFIPLPQYRYTQPVRVCTQCVKSKGNKAFAIEIKLAKCWEDASACSYNERHRFPLSQIVELLKETRENRINISTRVWKHSLDVLSKLIEIRYERYNQEAKDVINGIAQSGQTIVQNINGLNKFVAELHSDVLQGLKVKLPKDLKSNLIALRKIAGSKANSRAGSFPDINSMTLKMSA